MIPIGDSVKSRSTPYVNVTIIATSIFVFLYQLTLSTLGNAQFGFLSELDLFFRDWAPYRPASRTAPDSRPTPLHG